MIYFFENCFKKQISALTFGSDRLQNLSDFVKSQDTESLDWYIGLKLLSHINPE